MSRSPRSSPRPRSRRSPRPPRGFAWASSSSARRSGTRPSSRRRPRRPISCRAGRVDVGLGAGWFEQEFDAFGYPFGTVGERFDALEDALAITSGLFGGVDPLTHEGRVWSLHDGRLTPPPVQRPIPIWAGGKGGPRLLRAAARWARGGTWCGGWRPNAYADQVGAVRDACAAAARDPATFGLSLGLYGIDRAERGGRRGHLRTCTREVPRRRDA